MWILIKRYEFKFKIWWRIQIQIKEGVFLLVSATQLKLHFSLELFLVNWNLHHTGILWFDNYNSFFLTIICLFTWNLNVQTLILLWIQKKPNDFLIFHLWKYEITHHSLYKIPSTKQHNTYFHVVVCIMQAACFRYYKLQGIVLAN